MLLVPIVFFCTHNFIHVVGEEERKKETVCILLSLPYICLKSDFMGQIFLENFSMAVRYRYSLWKHRADCLCRSCLKRSWKRSALRETSFAPLLWEKSISYKMFLSHVQDFSASFWLGLFTTVLWQKPKQFPGFCSRRC